MKILYTGASSEGAEQLDPALSLGGHVSSSVIPNGLLSNIFSSVSALSIQEKRREVRMIVLQNDDDSILTDISLLFKLNEDPICKYKIALVAPTIVNGEACFEKLSNTNAIPYYATFADIQSEVPINISSIALDSYLGVWLIREYDFSASSLKKKTCEEWFQAYSANPDPEIVQEEGFDLTINYTIGEPSVSNSISNSISTVI